MILNLEILILPKLIICISNNLILWWNKDLIIIFKHVILIIRFIDLDISGSLINHLILLKLRILIFIRLVLKILVIIRINLVYYINVLILINFLYLIFTFEDLIKCHFGFRTMDLRSLFCDSINWMSLLNFILYI